MQKLEMVKRKGGRKGKEGSKGREGRAKEDAENDWKGERKDFVTDE